MPGLYLLIIIGLLTLSARCQKSASSNGVTLVGVPVKSSPRVSCATSSI